MDTALDCRYYVGKEKYSQILGKCHIYALYKTLPGGWSGWVAWWELTWNNANLNQLGQFAELDKRRS